MIDVQLLDRGFSAGEALARFAHAHPQSGGLASFVGKVRPDGDVKVLHLSHYDPLTLPGMEELAGDAMNRFALDGLMIWHRVGYLDPGTAIVVVSAAARHRRDAFDAVDFAMDHLKSAAWFWKREKRGENWRWIEPREQDHADLARWR